MTVPVLKTQRLCLRPFRQSDAKDVQRLAGDVRIAETTTVPHPYKDGLAESWIGTHEQRVRERNGFVWAICDLETDALLGCVGVEGGKPDTGMELGYWLGVLHWNKGFMSEAVAAVLSCAFQDLNIKRIYARYFVGNEASARVMQKNNMRLGNGILRDFAPRLFKKKYSGTEYFFVAK